MAQKLLEEYLNEVAQGLASLPAEQRIVEVEEIRQHLEALKAANLELGSTEQEAEEAAIRQFGPSQRVVKALKNTWHRIGPVGRSDFMKATLLATGVFLTPWTLSSVVSSLTTHQVSISLNGFAFLLTPLLVGLTMSHVARRYALTASLASVSLICFVLAVVVGVATLLHIGNDPTPFNGLLPLWLLLCTLTTCGVLVGKKMPEGGESNASLA